LSKSKIVKETIIGDNQMKKGILILVYIIFSAFFLYLLSYAEPKIVSVSINPTNPGYGDLVMVTVVSCDTQWQTPSLAIAASVFSTPQAVGSGGQVFLVDVNGIDRKDVTFGSSAQLGMTFTANTNPPDCTECSGGSGVLSTRVFTLHMPTADYYTVCNPTNLYIIVGMRNSYMGTGDWTTLSSCQIGTVTIPIPIPTPYHSIAKRVEGTLQAANDLVLFSVDYKYAGTGTFTITDPIPGGGNFTVVAYGPTNIPGGSVSGISVGATSGTATWTFPSRGSLAGEQSGTVWMLLRYTGGTPPAGTTYTNTASVTRGTTTSSSASITVGQPAITIQKYQSSNSVLTGTNITYYLSYSVNGYALRSFQPFDAIAAQSYTQATGPPSGWRFKPDGQTGEYGTWTISDPCNTGSRIITGTTSGLNVFPALLLEDGSSSNNSDQFCTGMIVTDVYINDNAFIGADAEIRVRTNDISGSNGRSLNVVISIDEFPARFYYAQCGGTGEFCGSAAGSNGPAGTWTNMPQTGVISAKKWYRVKILVTNEGGGQRIQAKIWARGDPEVPNWDINHLNTNLGSADWRCDGTGTYNDWRPGISQNTTGSGVQDSYDNFTTYEVRTTAASTTIWDTVPANVIYGGCNGCSSTSPVRWNIGSVAMTSGTLTWWGQVTGCSLISNQGLMGGTGLATIASNWVELEVLCWSPTFTPTRTFTNTPTYNPNTPTFTHTRTLTSTPSRTLTPTPSPSPSRTLSPTYSRTLTPSPSPSPSRTPTPTPSQSSSPTRTPTSSSSWTPTPTYTRTPTPSPSQSPSRTPTPTYSRTMTPTPTPSPSRTPTPSYTYTQTASPTSTPSRTATPTWTQTPSPSPTLSSSRTPTLTWTRTPTPTFSVTSSPTSTYTNTRTRTPTFTFTDTISSNTPTATPTFTRTYTVTPTPTWTNSSSPSDTRTVTSTPTNTITPSPSFTFTTTLTRTPTLTFTDTISSNTPTITPTWTRTYTSTPTFTETSSPTNTFTNTNTRTQTPSPTDTYTQTSTRTNTPTFTFTDTISSNTPTVTPTYTSTSTNSRTLTNTPTSTNTLTLTLTSTNTSQNTATNTSTITRTYTDTRTPTRTNTNTPTWTITVTLTNTPSHTSTLTFTPTYTITATATVTPDVHSAELSITLIADGENAQLGAIIDYKIIIENKDSSINAYNIKVWDTLPAEVEFIDSYSIVKPVLENGVVIWQLPKDMELKPGERIIIEFRVKMSKSDGIGFITNTASVDYQDSYYNDIFGNGRHPVITSNINEYPEEPIIAYPNPYKINGESKVIKFVNLPPNCTVQIYTISGESVISLNTFTGSRVVWNGKNRKGREVSAGIYYYVVLNKYSKQVVRGKIFIIK